MRTGGGHWRPIYEVSLGDADEVFALLTGLLRLLGANQAAQLLFVSDGAEWIWNRVKQLIEDAEIPHDRVRLVLDYYHATEHVWDASIKRLYLNDSKYGSGAYDKDDYYFSPDKTYTPKELMKWVNKIGSLFPFSPKKKYRSIERVESKKYDENGERDEYKNADNFSSY